MSSSVERFGELLVRTGVLDRQDIAQILAYQQEHPSMKFGEIGVKLGCISEEKLRLSLPHQEDS